ncbi:Hypp9669 [Branchiostoma lanceolatum]|uniref:Hypp9669 protein n=1 Tax=Branchiostoma lanceolatum TaxID=7740 RepID=A0A8S4MNT2_BRALA|nr:Hypp9669 [Branchiostoma lanceolatum]
MAARYMESRTKVVGGLQDKGTTSFTNLGTPRTKRRKFSAKYNVPPTGSPGRGKRFCAMLATAQSVLNPTALAQPDLIITAEDVICEKAK